MKEKIVLLLFNHPIKTMNINIEIFFTNSLGFHLKIFRQDVIHKLGCCNLPVLILSLGI